MSALTDIFSPTIRKRAYAAYGFLGHAIQIRGRAVLAGNHQLHAVAGGDQHRFPDGSIPHHAFEGARDLVLGQRQTLPHVNGRGPVIEADHHDHQPPPMPGRRA